MEEAECTIQRHRLGTLHRVVVRVLVQDLKGWRERRALLDKIDRHIPPPEVPHHLLLIWAQWWPQRAPIRPDKIGPIGRKHLPVPQLEIIIKAAVRALQLVVAQANVSPGLDARELGGDYVCVAPDQRSTTGGRPAARG